MELGGTQLPLDEASSYQEVLRLLSPQKPFGTEFKQLMRSSLLRDRLCGIELIGEDLPYSQNRVDLDPKVRDWRGLPVARITYGPGPSELAAQAFYMPWMIKLLKAAGAEVAIAIPELPSSKFPIGQDQVPATEHVMGGMPMGADASAERHRRAGAAPPPGQPLRGRRLRLPHLGRPQPDAHDHGHGPSPGGRLGRHRLSRRPLTAGRSPDGTRVARNARA